MAHTSSFVVCVICLGERAMALSCVWTRPQTCVRRNPEQPQQVQPYMSVDQTHACQILARRFKLRHLEEVSTLRNLENWVFAASILCRTVIDSKSRKEMTHPRYTCDVLTGIRIGFSARKHR